MADGQARRPPSRPWRSGQHVEPSTGGGAPDADPMPRRGDRHVPEASKDPGDPADHRAEDHRAEHRGADDPASAGDDLRDTVDNAAGGPRGATAIARRAAALVSTLTGRAPESMVSLERCDGGWRVGVEVVEMARIPDSADILAVYDVRLDDDGDLVSFQRTRRYPRGHLQREHRQ
jgi:hypothetical protein